MKKELPRTNEAAADGNFHEQLGVILEDMRGLARHIGRVATDKLHAVGDRARTVGDSATDLVRDRPMRSLLVAMGVGTLLGLLLRRR
jgi:ElaB/YqjD/DUF883 family membrane-anchored ribosome-binding protein